MPYNSTEEYKTISGGHVTATIEKDDAVASDRMETWIDRMDKVYTELQSFTGYTPYEGKKINILSSRENFSTHQPDGQNYWRLIMGWSGNPIKISQPFYHSHMRRSGSDWGDTPIHELSHDFDSYKWNFDNEALAFLKIPYVLQKQYAEVYRIDTMKGYSGMYYKNFLEHDWFEGYDESFKKGFYMPAGMATILLNIQEKTGWDAFGKTFRYFNELLDDQVPPTELGKLNLFLTQLQKFSGQDVFKLISTADKEILKTHFGGDIEPYTAPEIVFPQNSLGRTIDVSVQGGDYRQYQFKPSQSGKYTIFTSPYGESGVQNDTYIEVHTENSETAVPIATNDDWGDGRFSRTDVDLTANQVYYIKVYNYRRTGGRLHARLTIVKNITESELSEDVPQNVNVDATQFKMFKFTPAETGTYSFTADGYNGNPQTYDTYIKLYGGENLTNRIGQGENKIICNLTAGKTYYLQFSGMFMRTATGRVTVRRTNTLKFTKRNDSNFIYVNSPEYITRFDILDDVETVQNNQYTLSGLTANYMRRTKIYEQEKVVGKNTFYETHLAWYGKEEYKLETDPANSFYMDIDFYNPSNKAVTIEISNLAYGVGYDVAKKYYNGAGVNTTIVIPAHEHKLLFESINGALHCAESNDWAVIPVILFDFNVKNDHVTVSSIAAYSKENLRLRSGTKNIVDETGNELDNGELIYRIDSDGKAVWDGVQNPRPNETDLYDKYNGWARYQSGWIDAYMDIIIDESTRSNSLMDFTLKDDYYPDGIASPKSIWITNTNPLYDEYDAELYILLNGLHRFQYPSQNGKKWNFAYNFHNLKDINPIDSSETSMNNSVSEEIVSMLKEDVKLGYKKNFSGSPDPLTIGIGSWGATYHYFITVSNSTDKDYTLQYRVKNVSNMICGGKAVSDKTYSVQLISNIKDSDKDWFNVYEIKIPGNSVTSFEVITNLIAGPTGVNNSLYLK